MTLANYTHITMVIDRSGSMGSVREAAQTAVNQFIEEQQGVEGTATLTLVDFDSVGYNVVFTGNIKDAPKYVLSPRSLTPLYDSVGRAITETGSQLSALPEMNRPSNVLFVVQTDGAENCSKEYSSQRVQEMLKEQTDKYSWEFVFLGMGLDTHIEAQKMGFTNVVAAVVNNATSYTTAFSALSANTTAYRTGALRSMAGTNVDIDAEGNLTAKATTKTPKATTTKK